MTIWDERYAGGMVFGEQANDMLVTYEALLPRHARVLCVAEGQGRNAVFLAERGHAVTAIDASVVGLEAAKALAVRRGVVIDTIHADLTSYAWPTDAWDVIVSIWFHLDVETRRAMSRRYVEALVPGGWLLVEAYRPEQIEFGTGGPSNPDLLGRASDLAADVPDLDIVHAIDLIRCVREGTGHDGLSAVAQLVARKPIVDA